MPDTFRVTIAERAHTVELGDEEADAEGKAKLRVVVDGVEHSLDVRRVGPGAWSLISGAEARLVEVDSIASKLSVEVSHPDGEPRQAVVEVARVEDAATTELPAPAPKG